MSIRLQRFLSNIGFCSKRQAENFIRAGKILINGKKARIGDTVSGNEEFIVDGQKLRFTKVPDKKVLAFFKPKGVECSLTPSPNGKTLLDFDFGPDRIFPVGRLDKESHGLLLLTNDGILGNRLARPSVKQDEEYRVIVKGELTQEVITRLSQGIQLNDKIIVPRCVEKSAEKMLTLTLHDGRNRQIRQMCGVVDLHISDLKRVRIGKIMLGTLREGQWRVLNKAELLTLEA